jgi:hypothetical protein
MLLESLRDIDNLPNNSLDEVTDGVRDFYPNSYRLDEMELSLSQKEILDSGVSSDYNYEKFRGRGYDYSFLDSIYEKFYTQNGANIYVKDDQIEDYLSFINKVSPFCIMGYRLARELKSSRLNFNDIVMHIEGYTPLGLLVDRDSEYAENHLHLKGAGYLSFNFSKLISYKTPSKYYKRSFLKDIPRINEFSYINNHNLSIGQIVDILKFCKDIIYQAALSGERSIKNSIDDYGIKLQKIITINANIGIERGLSMDTISKLCKISPISVVTIEQRLLQKIVTYHDRDEYSKACMLESILLFYMYDKSSFVYLKRVIKISIHIVNILRSYMVMSQNLGLAHFSEFSRSTLRNAERRNAHNTATSIINSGTTHLNAKIGNASSSQKIERNLIDFIYTFDSKESDIEFDFGLSAIKGRERDIGLSHILEPRFVKKRAIIKKETLAIDDFLRNSRYKVTDRYQTMLKTNPKKAYQLKSKLKGIHYDLSRYIVSIDAVGKETHTPPEVFAPHFRYLRDAPKSIKHDIFLGTAGITYHKNLAFTVHAGEDFNHIITGMRRVDETIRFFEMQRGDRLGHMLSLGISPHEWIDSTHEIILYKGDYFDDLVWLTMKLKEISYIEMDISRYITIYTDKIWQLFREIYPMYSDTTPHISDLYDAWLYRRNCPITHYRRERGRTLFGEYEQRVLDKSPSPIAKELYELYQSSPAVRRSYREAYLVDKSTIKDAELIVWEALQDHMINEIAHIGITIETNPSSNISISSPSSYLTHPIFRFNPPKDIYLERGERFNRYGLRDGRLGVTINSDDPAIFVTSLQNEYRSLKKIAKEEYACTDKEADEWLEDIRKFGLKTFNELH